MTFKKAILAAASAAVLLVSPSFAFADEEMASRLSAIMDQERAAVAVIPADRVDLLSDINFDDDLSIVAQTGLIYNPNFLSAQPAPDGGAQWECLAEALYFEARGESIRGMFAVGEVILNRVQSNNYPDTLCNVINQGTGRKYGCQFTYTCDGIPENIAEPRAWERVGKVARLLLDGAPRALTGGATHYHTKAVNPSWAQRYPRTATIDSHHFYRQPVRTASN